MIAAESELEGLRQIYSDNNVRVRSTEARIAELRSQLSKLGGKYDPGAASATSPDGSSGASSDSYPTLRQLPILGVPYADKYRTLKVEEAVFETLTKQYELAKVQEAKEIPSVKVLDAPDIPERKSFPPRTLIVVGGAMLALAFSVLWILGEQRWRRIDPGDPGMVFAQEVYGTVRESLPWRASKNGSSNGHSGEPSNGDGVDSAP
jgi:capsule polysaccharide export protein KpsE/RkpR